MSYSDLEKKEIVNESDCYFVDTMNLIVGKWKPQILWFLLFEDETLRPGVLRKKIEGVTQKVLTQQLRELEKDGIISRRAFAEVPPRVEYSMTDYGRTLKPLIVAISEWGRTHLKKSG